MATKLYPPNIKGTIPAFSGTTLVVPFSLNRAVSKSEIAGFVIKLKTVQGSILLGTFTQMDSGLYDMDTEMQVSFNVSAANLNAGQYYKVQMAFIDYNNTIGYYSTVGVVKYTTKPHVEITGLVNGAINNHMYHYTGLYSQEGVGQDTSEKLYSSRFKLYDANGIMLKDSGEILHNVTADVNPYEAYESFTLNIDLEENSSYYLKYFVTTTNGYTTATPRYRIMQRKSITPDLKATLTTQLSYEDGYIDLYLVGEKDDEGIEQTAIGSFVVCRASSGENYVWNKVCEFSLQSQTPSRFLWRDYTIEQGVTYKYSVQQYNDYGLYSERIISDPIVADFEDAFLYDGERQLKIRYNPKVSSFKTDILEQKVETIGHKYPFIFRNGSVSYKEFPISGLISYQMDDNKLFYDWSREVGTEYAVNDLSSDAILVERLFKIEVLNWLNDGKPKLFRSPTEGNYIVQLMNTSLTPTDTLGRMLHTFSSTAYEIADFNYDNLSTFNLVSVGNATTTQMRWATVELAGHNEDLDTLLSNVRRYISAGIIVSLTEEQYNRILSYDYSLKDVFTLQSSVTAYALTSNTPKEVMSSIGTILGSVVTSDKTFTQSEYNKIVLKNNSLTTYFKAIETVLSYTLTPTARVNNSVISRLEEIIGAVTYVTGAINSRPVYSIFAVDMLPGTIIQLVTKQTGREDDIQEVIIGSTGSYRAEFEEPITSIIIPQTLTTDGKGILITGLQGSITYSYQSAAVNIFDTVRNLEIVDVPIKQWIGQQSKTYYSREADDDVTTTNLIDIIEDEKTSITDIFMVRFEKRPLQKIFIKALYPLAEFDDGILESSLPSGVRFIDASLPEAENSLNSDDLYFKNSVDSIVQSSDSDEERVVTNVYYKSLGNLPKEEDKTYYVKVYDYYTDMDCRSLLELDKLDPYYVYQICNARFDYTYQNVLWEKDFIDSNFEHGYYVDANGVKYDVFTGNLLDGLSNSSNIIIYDKDTYSNEISINGDIMDLTETERYSISKLDTPIRDIRFNNGIICELSYQTRVITYNVEYTDENVRSRKELYEAFKNKLKAHRLLMSIDFDKALALSKLEEGSNEYGKTEDQYIALKDTYERTLGSDYSPKNYMIQENYTKLETLYISKIQEYYTDFIRQLSISLKNYEEVNGKL